MNQKEYVEYLANIKYGTREWYLYHHIKNEDPIIPLVVLSCFLVICKGGIPTIIVIWIIYFKWASNNNRMLDNDPEILRSRQVYIESYLKKKR